MAVAQQHVVDARVVLADSLGNMGEIELDGSTAARLEVDEQRPFLRAEYVARVRFAVEQLLAGAAFADRSSQACKCTAEKLAIWVREEKVNLRRMRST